jgi:hypothetical protein
MSAEFEMCLALDSPLNAQPHERRVLGIIAMYATLGLGELPVVSRFSGQVSWPRAPPIYLGGQPLALNALSAMPPAAVEIRTRRAWIFGLFFLADNRDACQATTGA